LDRVARDHELFGNRLVAECAIHSRSSTSCSRAERLPDACQVESLTRTNFRRPAEEPALRIRPAASTDEDARCAQRRRRAQCVLSVGPPWPSRVFAESIGMAVWHVRLARRLPRAATSILEIYKTWIIFNQFGGSPARPVDAG